MTTNAHPSALFHQRPSPNLQLQRVGRMEPAASLVRPLQVVHDPFHALSRCTWHLMQERGIGPYELGQQMTKLGEQTVLLF